jgi:hypothetical protein
VTSAARGAGVSSNDRTREKMLLCGEGSVISVLEVGLYSDSQTSRRGREEPLVEEGRAEDG